MGIHTHCPTCGRAISVPHKLVGKTAECPVCGCAFTLPTGAPVAGGSAAPGVASPPLAPLLAPPVDRAGRAEAGRQSVSLPQLLVWLFVAWGAAVVLGLLVTVLVALPLWAILPMFLLLSALPFVAILKVIVAKRRALKFGRADTWFGFLQVAAWNPNEGVLFLRNKEVDFVDSNPNDGGGIRMVFPFLGEEEACRVPLEVQTSEFSDQDVLTREYVPLKITGTVYWRIRDVARFYLLVSREIHKVDNRGGHRIYPLAAENRERGPLRTGSALQLDAAVEWLRLIAEEQTRSVVAHVRTGLLAADAVAAALPPGLREQLTPAAGEEGASAGAGTAASPSSSKSYRSAAEGLGEAIREAMASRVPEFGIQIDRVSLQEARLPEEILAKAAEACTTAYLPLMAQRQAAADTMDYAAQAEKRRMQLAAEAEVLGQDALSKREVLGSIQPFALGGRGLVDFLTYYFQKAQGGAVSAGHSPPSPPADRGPQRDAGSLGADPDAPLDMDGI